MTSSAWDVIPLQVGILENGDVELKEPTKGWSVLTSAPRRAILLEAYGGAISVVLTAPRLEGGYAWYAIFMGDCDPHPEIQTGKISQDEDANHIFEGLNEALKMWLSQLELDV